MAESLSEAVKNTDDKDLEKPGGDILINVDAGNAKAEKGREAGEKVWNPSAIPGSSAAESWSKAAKSTDIKMERKFGSEFSIDIDNDNVEVAKEVCKIAIALGAFYVGYKLLRPVVEAAVKKALGGERDDQEVKDIRPGSWHVRLHCCTDERFMEVLVDCESGKMKEHFRKELFLQAGIKVEEIKVEIENTEEVKKKKETIKKRFDIKKNICEDVENTAMDDAKSNMKQNMENLKLNESLNVSKRKKDQRELTIAQLSYPVQLTDRNIITMGGMNADQNVLSSVATFRFPDQTYADLPPMNYPRYEAASCCVNNDHVTIMGGSSDGSHGLNSIEILQINQHPLRWTIFENILPFKLSCHALTVYQKKLLLIGGYNWDRQEISNEIYELPLTPPYTPRLWMRMPQPRNMHRAEIVDGSLFILGGRSTNNPVDGLASVIRYNPTSNEFEKCAPLPQPVSGMSTVTWGKKIIVVGGEDIHGHALNDVIMYDTESKKSERLPSLNHKRSGHSAVIINNAIVVLEGRNEGYLDSGEIFILETDQWIEVPEMTKKRYGATAVVKP